MKEMPRIREKDLEREAQVDAKAKYRAFAASLVRVLCKLLTDNQVLCTILSHLLHGICQYRSVSIWAHEHSGTTSILGQ